MRSLTTIRRCAGVALAGAGLTVALAAGGAAAANAQSPGTTTTTTTAAPSGTAPSTYGPPGVSGLAVTPSTGLVDGQTVTVTADIVWGPGRDHEYFLSLCPDATPGTGTDYGAGCEPVGGPYGLDVHDGKLSATVKLPAVIDYGRESDPVDCRTRPSCALVLYPYRQVAAGAAATVSFASTGGGVDHAEAVAPEAAQAPATQRHAPKAVKTRPRFTG
jgi:hypothetical protein